MDLSAANISGTKIRTMILPLTLTIIAAIQINLPAIQAYIPPQVFGWTTMAVAILSAVIRFLSPNA